MIARRRIRRTRGITTAGLVVGMTTLLAFVAVAVDIAILNSCDTEARAAADAAALAGAAELWDRSLLPPHLQGLGLPASKSLRPTQTVLERQMLHCVERACQVAALNTVARESVALSEDDMSFTSLAGEPSLTVQCSFTNQRGNPVSRLVGRALGLSDADLQIESQSILDQRVGGFAASSTANAPVIPIAIDANAWKSQVATSSIVTIQLVADGSEATASASLCLTQPPSADVVIDHRTSVSATFVDQIRSGIRKADLLNLPGHVIALSHDPGRPLVLAALPLSTHSLRDLGDALRSIAGRPRAWMLSSRLGDGNDSVACRVTSFVAARVLACSVDGERLTVVLEPCLFSTSTAVVRPDQVRNPWLAKVCLVQSAPFAP